MVCFQVSGAWVSGHGFLPAERFASYSRTAGYAAGAILATVEGVLEYTLGCCDTLFNCLNVISDICFEFQKLCGKCWCWKARNGSQNSQVSAWNISHCTAKTVGIARGFGCVQFQVLGAPKDRGIPQPAVVFDQTIVWKGRLLRRNPGRFTFHGTTYSCQTTQFQFQSQLQTISMTIFLM